MTIVESLPSVRNTQAVLTELRSVIDARERLAAEDRALAKRREELESSLLSFHDETGLDSLSGAGLSISFDSAAMRCKYEPDLWASIIRWAVDSGNDFIIQRRLTDAKVLDLIAQ